ncbi:MAG: phospho-sugar mutase [SAR324 cluster bacterium]|nr:phospho-sugar mutase [SAR324 cluster bacterium]
MQEEILKKARAWVENPYIDDNSKEEINRLIESSQEEELVSRFYKNLEFGTAGMRGKVEAGSNRFNVYVVRQASQGLADYLKQNAEDAPASIAIAFDNRTHSEVFSQEAASVFAGNGIKVYIFPSLRPTPMLSFAVRELKTNAGIVITASHNPREYNGYKVYWSDGCQINAPHDSGIMAAIELIQDYSKIRSTNFETALKEKQIEIIEDQLDQKYYGQVEQLCLGDRENNKNLHFVYTPLHGTGNIPVREILQRRGFQNVSVVEEQELPDGNFPTVRSPNPEDPAAFTLAKKTARENEKLLLANDPDSDRLGALVRQNGDWINLNGNQIGQLLLDYYLRKLKEVNRLPLNGFVVSTIVTSELTRKIAEGHGLRYYETLTGFKNIGQIIRTRQDQGTGQFVFGMEEANGYLLGDFVRDKDGVSALVVFAEMIAELAAEGHKALDQLELIHQNFGFHEDSLINHVLEGKSGAEQIQNIMKELRTDPPKTIGRYKVNLLKDYQQNLMTDPQTGKVLGSLGLPVSNVLAFYMEDGSRITARPSGTEPKIKFYFNLCGDGKKALSEARKHYEQSFMSLIENFG